MKKLVEQYLREGTKTTKHNTQELRTAYLKFCDDEGYDMSHTARGIHKQLQYTIGGIRAKETTLNIIANKTLATYKEPTFMKWMQISEMLRDFEGYTYGADSSTVYTYKGAPTKVIAGTTCFKVDFDELFPNGIDLDSCYMTVNFEDEIDEESIKDDMYDRYGDDAKDMDPRDEESFWNMHQYIMQEYFTNEWDLYTSIEFDMRGAEDVANEMNPLGYSVLDDTRALPVVCVPKN